MAKKSKKGLTQVQLGGVRKTRIEKYQAKKEMIGRRPTIPDVVNEFVDRCLDLEQIPA